MGFTNQERTNFASKVLAGGVIDANEVAQWYESRFPNEFVLDARKVWTELEIVRGYPAANITTARTYCSGVLLGIVEDKAIARAQPLRQIENLRILHLSGTGDAQHARRIAR